MAIEDFRKHVCKGQVTGVVTIGGKEHEIRQPIDGRKTLAKIGWEDEAVPYNLAAGHKACPNCGLDFTVEKNTKPITKHEFFQLSGGHKEAREVKA